MTTQTKKDEIWQLCIVFIECINCLRHIHNNTKKRYIEQIRGLIGEQEAFLEKLRDEFLTNTNIQELLSIRNKIQKSNQQIENIRVKFQNLQIMNEYLAKLVTQNTNLYTMTMHEYKNNKNSNNDTAKQCKIDNIKHHQNGNYSGKQILELFIFGYVRKLIEDKYDMMIPYYLKMLCLEFYGNIIMDTNILNVNQLNTFGYVLKSSFDKKSERQYAYTQKIYDSKKDGFNAKLVDTKCGHLDYKSIIIMKTNQNHITICIQSRRDGDIDQMIGCLLQSPISTIPMVYHSIGPTYHFSNDFEANYKEKLSDIVTEYDSSIIHKIECLEPNINDKIDITEFEIFIVQ